MTDLTLERPQELELLASLRKRLQSLTFSGEGRLAGIVVAPKHSEHVTLREARIIPDVGVEGDRPYKQFWRGRRMAGRQVSAINAEALDALGIDYAVPGDNLIVSGLDLSLFQKGDALQVGDAILIATGAAHHPCKHFRERTSTAHYLAIRDGRMRGTMFNALHAATVRVGDLVQRILLTDSSE